MPERARVEALIAEVEAGRFVEAIQEFYAPNATMQENGEPPRKGIDVLVGGERMLLKAFRSITTRPVRQFFVDGDHSVIHWTFDFVHHDGTTFAFDELALQRWDGDHIVEEVFYYDPGQRRPASGKA